MSFSRRDSAPANWGKLPVENDFREPPARKADGLPGPLYEAADSSGPRTSASGKYDQSGDRGLEGVGSQAAPSTGEREDEMPSRR